VSEATVIAAAWGWDSPELTQVSGGLINLTYAVHVGGIAHAALQRLHPIFAAEVNLDIDRVTTHLAGHGLVTPRLLRTRDGHSWIQSQGHIWRALSWVPGHTLHAVDSVRRAEAGGLLVGRFHRALLDLDHEYQFARAGVHDTRAHLENLRRHLAAAPPATEALQAEARDLGHHILGQASSLAPMDGLPRRHCHGDLKISNLLFSDEQQGVCLVDLDTVGRQTLAFELGDAMRSWCNPTGEDTGQAQFDAEIFSAAIRGYRDVAARFLDHAEAESIAIGLETVCVELAARFCVDVFEDRYFGWDPARFSSRRQHNLVRAQGQLALATSVGAQRELIRDVLLASR
jgi:Ser/Thr protein kinase RdoA (MazF antagonist)